MIVRNLMVVERAIVDRILLRNFLIEELSCHGARFLEQYDQQNLMPRMRMKKNELDTELAALLRCYVELPEEDGPAPEPKRKKKKK